MNLRPDRIRAVKRKPVLPKHSVLHEDGRLTIWMPIPARGVSPNAQRGQSKIAAIRKSGAVKRHRILAQLLLKDALTVHGISCPDFAGYSLAFFYPTTAYRDDDNADASCKAYRDGMADALQMNDRYLKKCRLSLAAKDAAQPRVEITLHPAPLPTAPTL